MALPGALAYLPCLAARVVFRWLVLVGCAASVLPGLVRDRLFAVLVADADVVVSVWEGDDFAFVLSVALVTFGHLASRT